MKQTSEAATPMSDIELACSHYLQQLRALMPLDVLTVVMLDPAEDTGKVVFSWRASTGANFLHSRASAAPVEPGQSSVMNITLYDSDGPIGGVLLHTSLPNRFSQLHRRLGRDLSAQLAMQLENVRLYQQLQATSQKIALLDEVSRIVNSSPDLERTFVRLAHAISQLIELDFASLSWIDPYDYEIHALKSGEAWSAPARFKSENPISYSTEVIASLETYRSERPFNALEQGLLALVANQIAPAVQSARHHHRSTTQSHNFQPEGSLSTPMPPARQDLAINRPDLTGDLAHALGTPLTTIKGYTSSLLLSDGDWPPEVQREFLKTIDQATDRLTEAVRELLQSARPKQGSENSNWTVTTLQDLLSRAESELRDRSQGLHIQFRCQAGAPTITVDQHLIVRAIKHLVDYWLDTTGPTVSILVEASPGGDDPIISLAADRSGHQNHGDVSSNLSRRDTDLRMAACRKILEAHRTTLNIDTSREGMVCFWFPLPRSASEG